MGRAASLLTRRAAAFCALAAVVLAWYLVAPHLPKIGLWWDVLIVSYAVMPPVLGLIILALPIRDWRGALPLALAFTALAALFVALGWGLPANFAKLGAAAILGLWFLRLFEELWWVLLVAVIVPFVDAFSVWRGPTHAITSQHLEVYTTVAIAFVGPHDAAAYLGPPDILFFALFLAAAARFRLRVNWTWLTMTGLYGTTIVIANALDVDGLPALPFLSAAFLLANADVLLARMRASQSS